MNPLLELHDLGQSIWLDFIDRNLLESGRLVSLVTVDGVRGVTSNPSIFDQALAKGLDYDEALEELVVAAPDATTVALYESLAVADIRVAADLLRPVYDHTGGGDGFVSLEVSPHLADDTAGTIDEARRLWSRIERPNLMIKVPATTAGMPAIETLIAEGINVNVTLIFSLEHYEGAAQAYLRGLERNADPGGTASVASFFVSRVDSAVDGRLEDIGTEKATALRGRAAIANAKLAYRRFEELFGGDRFAALRRQGARVQRPLWASTSTKNPAYRDVVYVEELIGVDTVNTLPPATLEAFRDHGRARTTVTEGIEEAAKDVDDIAALGIDLDAVTSELQSAGVASFVAAFDRLLAGLDEKRRGLG